VGESYLEDLTPDELRNEAALVAGALGAQNLSDSNRQLLEQNLQTIEDHASAQGIELAAATAYRLRQVILTLGNDLRTLGTDLKSVLSIDVMGREVGADYPNFSPFLPEVVWNQEQLVWGVDALDEANDLTATAQGGGAQSTQQFRAAGIRITAVVFESQAVAIHLGYLHVGVVAASDFIGPGTGIASKVRSVREELDPILAELRSLNPSRVERAVTELQSGWHSFGWDFGVFVEELEEHAHTLHRIRQVVGLIELAMLARGLMPARRGGGPSIAGGPSVGGATATVAIARGAVGSIEWVEAMRRLAAIGAISAAAAVGRIGGGTPMPAKPTLTATAPVKPSGTSGTGSDTGKTGGPIVATSKVGSFKEVAGKIHGMRQPKGQAIAVIEVRVGDKIRNAAAANSGAGFTPEQLSRLRELDVEVIPSFGKELVHAEQNIAAWVANLRTQGMQVQVLKWGVSATRTGAYICTGCRQIAKELGGVVEEFSLMGKTY
jgi:hypothetical protein